MLKIKMLRSEADVSNERITEAGYELKLDKRTLEFIYFIHKDISPATLKEAEDLIAKTFFFSPYAV